MNPHLAPPEPEKFRRTLDYSIWIGASLLVALLLVNAALGYRNTRQLNDDAREVAHTNEVLGLSGHVLGALADAESGVRGFIITGKGEFLHSYQEAIAGFQGLLRTLKEKTNDNPDQQTRIQKLDQMSKGRLDLFQEAIALRQQNSETAAALITTGKGKAQTDAIRGVVREMEKMETNLLAQRQQANLTAYEVAVTTGLLAAALGLVMVGTFVFVLHRSHQAQTQTQERVLLASDAAQLGFWSWEPEEDTVVWENEHPYRIFGLPRSSAPVNAARFVAEFLHPDDVADFNEAFTRTVKAGEPLVFTGRIRRADGETRWIEFTGKSQPGRDGRAPRVIGTVQDVTQRKLTEEALREKAHFLQRIAQITPSILHVFDLVEKRAVFINHSVATLLGYSPEEVLEMGAEVLPILMHPEDVPKFEQHMAQVRTRADGEVEAIEFRVHDRAGEWHWFHSQATVFARDGTGVPRQLIGVATDITERKRTEAAAAQLAAIVESSQDAIVSKDLHGTIITWNRGAKAIFGFSAEEIVGKSILQLVPPERHHEETEILSRIAKGEGLGHFETVRLRKDGSTVEVSVTVSPIKDDAGNIIGASKVAREITERKKGEERMRLIEKVILQMHDAVMITKAAPLDEPGPQIVYVNPAFTRLTGYTAEEVIGKSPRFMQGPKTSRAELDKIRAALERMASVKVEITNYRKDGTAFETEFEIVPVADETGRFTHFLSVQRDITERKRVEESLRENSGVFSTLIAQAPMGTYVVDGQFRLRQVNAEAMSVFATVQPLIGRDFGEVMEILWGPKVGRECADIFRRTLATGDRYISPPFTEMRHDLGIEQTYEWQTQRVTLPDGEYGVVCYFHEVTERARATEALRSSRERMRLAAEATGVGIWEWNLLTNTIRWDRVLFDIYGIEPTHDGIVHYSDWSGAVLPEDLAANEAILRNTVRRCGQSSRTFRIRRRRDGECRYVEAVETVIVNAEGRAESVVGTNLDVTERKRAERAIHDEAKRKDDFLAMLGHELRNPLNAIRHAVQIAEEATDDASAARWAGKVIDRQSQQLSRMVDDLLDVARINRGRIELRVESLDLGPVLEQAILVARPLFAQRRHTFTSEIAPQLAVSGDTTRLEQVFVNLLTNAAKYTPEDGSISVRAHKEDGEVVVAIRDNGVGISPELLPHVFDLFSQGDSTLDRSQGGLGIGLNVVKSLVEMHLGRVAVESGGANQGTTVTVRLPLLLEVPASAHAAAQNPADATLPKAMRVLIVDDLEDAAQALGRLLTRRGFEVRCAHTGPDGVTVAREFRPEALLLDLGLPGFDGYEVARILRAEASFADTIFIAISGYAQDADRQRCLAGGFDEHLPKPIDIPQLLNAIRSRRVK